jgi:nucleotide-binding universal stress UspA family protein
MSLKDLVVLIDDSRSNDARVALALNLARTHEAHLAGVHLLTNPDVPPYLDSTVIREIVRQQREKTAATAAMLERKFREESRRQGVAAEWRAVRDFYEEGIVQARYADLVITGQNDPDVLPPRLLADTSPALLAMTSGRPVLAVPYAGQHEMVGRRVLVAWQPSREATRAVNDALPLIRRSDAVTVLVVDSDQDPRHSEEPGADIALHLARHGVKARVERTISADISVADVILSRAADLGSDLLVMGAYGHSRLREFVLGGVTREILRQMTLPVLFSH